MVQRLVRHQRLIRQRLIRHSEVGQTKGFLRHGLFMVVHMLMDILSKSRLKHQMLEQGRPDGGSDNELALIVSQIRRKLSLTAVKAQVSCLLSRLHQVGPGNKQLAKKRQWATQQDEKMRRERYSQWIRYKERG